MFPLFSMTEKTQVPKSFHYQVEDKVVNLKEEEQRQLSLLLTDGTESSQKKEHTFLTQLF